MSRRSPLTGLTLADLDRVQGGVNCRAGDTPLTVKRLLEGTLLGDPALNPLGNPVLNPLANPVLNPALNNAAQTNAIASALQNMMKAAQQHASPTANNTAANRAGASTGNSHSSTGNSHSSTGNNHSSTDNDANERPATQHHAARTPAEQSTTERETVPLPRPDPRDALSTNSSGRMSEVAASYANPALREADDRFQVPTTAGSEVAASYANPALRAADERFQVPTTAGSEVAASYANPALRAADDRFRLAPGVATDDLNAARADLMARQDLDPASLPRSQDAYYAALQRAGSAGELVSPNDIDRPSQLSNWNAPATSSASDVYGPQVPQGFYTQQLDSARSNLQSAQSGAAYTSGELQQAGDEYYAALQRAGSAGELVSPNDIDRPSQLSTWNSPTQSYSGNEVYGPQAPPEYYTQQLDTARSNLQSAQSGAAYTSGEVQQANDAYYQALQNAGSAGALVSPNDIDPPAQVTPAPVNNTPSYSGPSAYAAAEPQQQYVPPAEVQTAAVDPSTYSNTVDTTDYSGGSAGYSEFA